MLIKAYSQLAIHEQESFFKFLSLYKEDTPAMKNMWADDWPNKNYTLPYLLTYSTRFKTGQGEFHILYDHEKIAGCAGVYKSLFSDNVSLIGTRAMTFDPYKHKNIMRNHIFPANKKWALDNNFKIAALCFNDYNKNMPMIFKRSGFGKENTKPYSSNQIFYDNYNELTFPVSIQNTKQWVIYERLDPTWDYDWRQIEWKNEDSINRT